MGCREHELRSDHKLVPSPSATTCRKDHLLTFNALVKPARAPQSRCGARVSSSYGERMNRSQGAGVAAAIAAAMMVSGAAAQQMTKAEQDQKVHINQIQVIGSHNSYHAGFAPSERKLLEAQHPKTLRSLDYRHAPLADQLNGGVRQIEIDVFNDPQGGKFAHPAVVNMVAAAHLPPDPDFDPNHEMDKPGFKVLHVQDLDERATCHTFVMCLNNVRDWSKQHPRHLPIFILVETKEGVP